MNMGSSRFDTCTDNATNGEQLYEDTRSKRPVFYPCEVCGRKFTMRAMVVHKNSCLETEGCKCLVCKSSKKLKWDNIGLKKEKDSSSVLTKRASGKVKTAHVKPRIRDLLTGKTFSSKNGTVEENNVITFKLVENHIIDKMVGCNNLDKNEDIAVKFSDSPTYDDHKYVSVPSELSDNSNTNDDKQNDSSDQFSMFTKINDKVDHDCTRKIYCSVCDDHIYWESFAPHLLEHCEILDNNSLKCPGCERVFNKPAYILTHFIVHILSHPENCSSCRCGDPNCIDARERALAEHCYADSSLYYCYICLTRFSHNQTVSNHMRLHTNEMPFTCTECNRSFRQIGNLQRHMTTHRGDRPHKCPDCCRSFADPATLRNHLRVHTGETPFVCSICKRGFSQVGNLKRHMALHLPKEATSSIEIAPDENVSTVSPLDDVKLSPNSTSESLDSSVDKQSILDATANSIESQTEVVVKSGKGRKRKKSQKMKVFTCDICFKVYAWHHDLQVHYRTHTGLNECVDTDVKFESSVYNLERINDLILSVNNY